MKKKASADATLLVINREPQAIMMDLFDAHQYRVETLHRAESAWEYIHELQPDLVLLGLRVPGADSYALCRKLKENPATRYTPVIMTDISTKQEAAASADAGADDMQHDPPHPGETIARVRLMLRLKRQYEDQNRRLEEALLTEKKAKVLIENIVNNLSHELRTPLLQVKGSISLIRSDGRDGGPAFTDALISQAVAATARLEEIVNNLSQLATASQPMRAEAFRIQDLMPNMLRQRERRWSTANAISRITQQIYDVPPVYSDRNAVTQVLQQLLDNAIKFSPDDSPVEIIARKRGKEVSILVRDYGIGIAPENLDDIFQAFYQVDNSERRLYPGAGVGLAIVKMLLDSLGAQVVVDSKPGKGSTFGFNLPIAPRT